MSFRYGRPRAGGKRDNETLTEALSGLHEPSGRADPHAFLDNPPGLTGWHNDRTLARLKGTRKRLTLR
jgi:hypothetical protein